MNDDARVPSLDYLTSICMYHSISLPLEFPVQRSRFPISTSFFSSPRRFSSLSIARICILTYMVFRHFAVCFIYLTFVIVCRSTGEIV